MIAHEFAKLHCARFKNLRQKRCGIKRDGLSPTAGTSISFPSWTLLLTVCPNNFLIFSAATSAYAAQRQHHW